MAGGKHYRQHHVSCCITFYTISSTFIPHNIKMYYRTIIITAFASLSLTDAFALTSRVEKITSLSAIAEPSQKNAFVGMFKNTRGSDEVLACPRTKEPLRITTTGPLLGGVSSSLKVCLKSSDATYNGRTNMYYDLLQQAEDVGEVTTKEESSASFPNNALTEGVVKSLRGFIPPPLASILSERGILPGDEYVTMRDMFTSPSVSFAYERGWRQSFSNAGFPGADKEYEMVTIFEIAIVDYCSFLYSEIIITFF